MKTESVRKMVRIGSVLLIGIAICISAWFFLSEHKVRELQGESRPPRSNHEISTDTSISPQPSQNSTGDTNEKGLESTIRRAKSHLMSSFSEEILAKPSVQKALEAVDSPEALDVLLSNDFSIRKWNDYLESQGVPANRGGYSGIFRRYFPTGEPEDYEPEMRLKIAEIFLAAELVDLTAPEAAVLQRAKVLLEFAEAAPRNIAWFVGQFGEDWDRYKGPEWAGMERSPTFIWMTDVQQNAASIVAAAATVRADALKASAPSWDMSSVAESSKASDSETEMPAPLDTKAHPPMTDAEIEAAIEKSLTLQTREALSNERPDTPGGIQSNIEASLKARFSSERFDRAMDTLDKYGLQEGLRRLREHDPAVAKQIEKARHHNRQEDAQ